MRLMLLHQVATGNQTSRDTHRQLTTGSRSRLAPEAASCYSTGLPQPFTTAIICPFPARAGNLKGTRRPKGTTSEQSGAIK